MLSFRRFSLVCATVGLLAGCSTIRNMETADADLLRGEISSAVETVESGERLPVGKTFVAPGQNVPVQVLSFQMLAGWEQDNHAAALQAFRVSCATILKMSSAKTMGGLETRIEDWRPVCKRAQRVDLRSAKAFFERAFQPVRLAPRARALVTSYYEPELRASRRPTGAFVHPLYARPPEVITRRGDYGVMVSGKLRPFLTRGQIYQGALRGRGLEIAYLDDAVDSFFLHVQGSGRLRFHDGKTTRVSFSAKNGHDYSSVGREMIRRGLTTRGRASAQIIQEYVRANPAEGMALLATNKSFIFFREATSLDPRRGPVGALGVQLTDGRSIAVDRRFTPLGAPVWLETDNSPVGPLRRLVIAQDTGSAIKGVQRADYFWGTGDAAGEMAGRMKHKGALTVLLPVAALRRLSGLPNS